MKKTITFLAAAILVLTALAPAAVAASDIEGKIAAKLVEAFGEDGKSIKVTEFEGTVTFIGRVKERATQELAEEVALYFPEVKKVKNELKSEDDRGLGKGQLKDESKDAKLESSVKSALAAEIGAYAKDVEIEAADGAVSIRGTLPDEQRMKYALDAAKKVDGVKKVVDLIRVAAKN